METISLAVLTFIAATFAVLTVRRHSPTTVLAMSVSIIFLMTWIGDQGSDRTLYELGLNTSRLFAGEELWTLVTSMFLHADFFHLIFNMLFLIAIGIPLESRVGRWRFLTIYFAGGISGSLIFAALEWSTDHAIILVGASGAISALLGAMLMLYPKDKITFFLGPFITNRFSVWVPIFVWFLLQLLLFSFDGSPVAYAAHIGGFAAGAAIAWAVRPKNLPERAQAGMHDISSLRPLCTTPALREMYEYAANARDGETGRIWVERILADVRCPVCGAEIRVKGKGFECRDGHRTE